MGFLRDWYRDNCVEPGSKKAQMFLTDGKYASAGSEYQCCGMYWEAAEAYMKAAEQEADEASRWDNYYGQAAENYEKTGNFVMMRKAYERGWRRSEHTNIEKLAIHGQLDQFCKNVRNHKPNLLVFDLKHASQWMLCVEMCKASVELSVDAEDKPRCLREAMEYGIKASMDEYELLLLHEEYFRAEIAVAESWTDLFFQSYLSWIVKTGNLVKFVDDLIDDFPTCLWFVIYEGIDHIEKNILENNKEKLAKSLLQCVKKAESIPLLEKDWKFIGQEKNYYAYTACRLKAVGMFVDAAEMFVASAKLMGYTSDFKEAIECYKKANQPLKAAEILKKWETFKESQN